MLRQKAYANLWLALMVAVALTASGQQTDRRAATTTVVSASPTSTVARQSVALTSTVQHSAFGIASGTVGFFDGATQLGQATLSPVLSGGPSLRRYDSSLTYPGVSSSDVFNQRFAVGDIDRDGITDAVVASSGALDFFYSSATQPFSSHARVLTVGGLTLSEPVIGDFAGIRSNQLQVAGISIAKSQILFYNSQGFLATESLRFPCPTENCSNALLAVGDFDGNGVDDLASEIPNSGYRVLLNPLTDRAAVAQIDVPNQFYAFRMVSARLRGANEPSDLVIEGYLVDSELQSTTALMVFSYDGEGSFVPRILQGESTNIPLGPGSPSGDSLAVDDVNNDGYMDVLLAQPSQGTVSVFLATEKGGLKAPYSIQVSTPTNFMFLAVQDVNADGIPDVAVMSGREGQMHLLLNEGGNLVLQSEAVSANPLNSTVGGIFPGDFNGDHYGDVALFGADQVANEVSQDFVEPVQVFFTSANAQATFTVQSISAGTHNYTANYGGDSRFQPSKSSTVAVTARQIQVTLTWNPAPISAIAALGPDQLNATATAPAGQAVSGKFVYNPPAGTVLPAGTQTLNVIFTPDSSDFATAKLATPITVKPAIAPTVTFTGPSTSRPADQPAVQLSVSNYSVPLTPVLTLAFTSGVAGYDGANARSPSFSNASRTLTLAQIAANTTPAIPPVPIQVGTVAGSITVTLKLLTPTNVDVTPAETAALTIAIPAAPPSITATLTRDGNLLTVDVSGYSDTREISEANFQFTGANGVTVQTPQVAITNAQQLFATWYQDQRSNAEGGSFHYTQQFSVSGTSGDIGSVSVTLANGVGSSEPASAQ